MSLFDIELPRGRQWLRLGDAYEVTRKPRGLDRASLPLIPFAPMETIPQGGAYAPDYTLRKPGEIKSGTYFERGDILVAKITPSFENGKQALAVELPTPFGYATTEVIPLRPRKKGHDRRLLFFYLLHPDVRGFVAERMEGTTGRQRIPEDVILDLPLPEFEPEEQAAVADSLEMVQRLMAVESRSIQTATDLKRAAMRTLFTRGLRGEAQKEAEIGPVPESWEIKTYDDVAEKITVGVVVRPASHYVREGVPAFRSLNVKQDRLDTSDLVFFSEEENDGSLSKSRLRVGDILVVRTGYPGTSCVVPKEFDGANCIDLGIVSPNRKYVLPEFLSRFLNSEAGRAQSGAEKHGLAQQHLNIGAIKRLKVPLPPTLNEQGEIVEVLDAVDRKIDLHRRKRAVLEELFKALLHKLMTGEIRVGELDFAGLEVY